MRPHPAALWHSAVRAWWPSVCAMQLRRCSGRTVGRQGASLGRAHCRAGPRGGWLARRRFHRPRRRQRGLYSLRRAHFLQCRGRNGRLSAWLPLLGPCLGSRRWPWLDGLRPLHRARSSVLQPPPGWRSGDGGVLRAPLPLRLNPRQERRVCRCFRAAGAAADGSIGEPQRLSGSCGR
jgi:hypothetical protein